MVFLYLVNSLFYCHPGSLRWLLCCCCYVDTLPLVFCCCSAVSLIDFFYIANCVWMCFCPVFVLLFPMLLFCFPGTLLLVCLLLSLLGLGPDESLVSSTSFTNDLEIQWLQPDMCESCMQCYIYNICDNFVLHQVRPLSSDALHYLWTSLSSNFENQYTIIIV